MMKQQLLVILGFMIVITGTGTVPDLSPGPEYADSVRMFQGVPGIERSANGRLWATWYSGGVTEDKNNYVLLYTSGDNGASWQQVLVIDPDGAGPRRTFDPCLWHDPDGKLWLFWGQETTLATGRDAGSFVTFAITTEESGRANAKWSVPKQIAKGVMMNKPTVTADGRWLLPISSWNINNSARAVVSTNHGATFAELGAANVPPGSRNADEHMIVQRSDNSLWMLVRGKFITGVITNSDSSVVTNTTGIGQSSSTDGGQTWSGVTASSIPHPLSRFFIRRLTSNRLLLVRHNPPNGEKSRSHLTAFLSEDDGLTWNNGLILDERIGVSYPDGVQATDGSIYVIYDYQRTDGKEILMAVFTEEDVLAGRLTSTNSRRRILINKATGIIPGKPLSDQWNSNADGAPMLTGPAAEFECTNGQVAVWAPRTALFTDRTYTANEVSEALNGFSFLQSSIDPGVHAVCRKAGVVYIATPSPGRNVDSRATLLLSLGFEKVNIPEFLLFGSTNNLCSAYQKQVAAGESIALGKWSVLITP